jgi:hypothetical protein
MSLTSPRGLRILLLLLIGCFLSVPSAQTFPGDDEPVAYVGHGALFDANGKEIVPTPEFIAKAQEWYREHLMARLTPDKRSDFATLDKQFRETFQLHGQAQLVVQQRTLDWLMANSPDMNDGGRTMSKLNALKFQLRWKLPQATDKGLPKKRELFKLTQELDQKLSSFVAAGIEAQQATVNAGKAYNEECAAAGVPTPPTIGKLDPQGLNGWKTQGFIPPSALFIVNTPTEVRTYHSSSPEGLCIALPRYTDDTKTTVGIDGVICLGQKSSKVCFWDNQMMGAQFEFPAGTQIPIGAADTSINAEGKYQAGGLELKGGSGGTCTDCHAGENPFIVHPQVDLGGGLKMGQLNKPPLNLPTFSVDRYNPIVAAEWPQNASSQDPSTVPPICQGCHMVGGMGGRLPQLSSQLPAYCKTILPQAIMKTMPPGAAGSQAGSVDVVKLLNFCKTAPSVETPH